MIAVESVAAGCRSLAIGTVVTIGLSSQTCLAQQVQQRVDVSVGGAYSTDPFLAGDDTLNDGSSAGASIYVQVDPSFSIEDETTTVGINGTLRYGYYPGRYGSDETARIGANYARRVDERLVVTANLSGQTSRSAAQDVLFDEPSVLQDDNAFPEPVIIDLTVAGQRARSYALSSRVGAGYSLSPVDALNIGIEATGRFYEGRTASDFALLNTTLQYGRQIDETFSVNGQLEIGRVNYLDQSAGDASILAPTVGVEKRLSETASLRARVGAAIAKIDLGPFGEVTRTFLTGNVAYCDRLLSGSLCASAGRSARPTGFAGVVAVSNVSVGYSRELTDRSSISASLRYARNDRSGPTGLIGADTSTEFWGATGTYRQKIGDRLSAFVTPTVSRVLRDARGSNTNVGILAGVTMTFGDRR